MSFPGGKQAPVPAKFIRFQILNLSDDGNSGDQKITIQAVGRQKCRLLSPLRYADIYSEDWTITMFDRVRVMVVQDSSLPRLFYLPGSSINRMPEKMVNDQPACNVCVRLAEFSAIGTTLRCGPMTATHFRKVPRYGFSLSFVV